MEFTLHTPWMVIEDSEYVHVVPLHDSHPHGTITQPGVAELTGIECPCKPRVFIADKNGFYRKPVINHRCFRDEARIAKSVAAICG